MSRSAQESFWPVLLLDRPEQAARLVQARVVGPAIEGRKALVAGASTTPTVTDAVRACGVPCHADEEWPIVAVIGWPPVLRGRHHLFDVLLQRIDVKGLNRLGVVEILVHRIGQGRILAENLQVQLIRPPVLIGSHFVPPLKCSEYGATFWNRCKPAEFRNNKGRSLVSRQGESGSENGVGSGVYLRSSAATGDGWRKYQVDP